jgi:uncharacterized membrane protein
VPVGPGKSFKTHYVIKPVRGFTGFTYASQRLVAHLDPREVAGTVRITHDLAAVTNELHGLQVEFTVVGWKSKKEIARKAFQLDTLTFAKTRQEFTIAPPQLTDGIVIQTRVTGAGWEERYETFYDGAQKAAAREQNYFATKGGALAGTQGDTYLLKQPRKVKPLDKPDFATLRRPQGARPKCLLAYGLFTRLLRLDDIVEADFTVVNCPPNGIEQFPGTYDELFAYNVIVLSDVNFKALSDIGFEMLCDYVEHGGALLVTGGPYALGNGEFEETRFLDVLPVTLSGPFDLKWAGKGKSWTLTARPHSIARGLSFEQKPRVVWEHFVKPKRGVEVVLQAGGHPALVVGRYGQGRVAVWTPSPTGTPADGQTAWWDWNDWPQLARNIFEWLNEK